MPGICIISFDCEGKWGLADQPFAPLTRKLNDDNLRQYYAAIFDILDKADVPATFATVQLFLKDRSEVSKEMLAYYAEKFPYLKDIKEAFENEPKGWNAPWLIDAIGSKHEIGFHGFTHIPWNELSQEDARAEIEGTPEEFRQTIIFPRNRVSHLDILAEYGCKGYRASTMAGSKIKKLAAEFNPFSAPAEPIMDATKGMTAVPAGYFMNWQNGPRRLVPRAISKMRVRQTIQDAARTGSVAHYWIHPENIATHPETLGYFQDVVDEMARARAAGQVEILTQLEYCNYVASQSGPQNG
jgi:hypothetical protein